jgi:hypothetical protein
MAGLYWAYAARWLAQATEPKPAVGSTMASSTAIAEQEAGRAQRRRLALLRLGQAPH